MTGNETLERFLANACGMGGSVEVARELLAEAPELGTSTIFGAVVAGQAEAAAAMLEAHPALATVQGGPGNLPPLFYACFSRMGNGDPECAEKIALAAKHLLDHGADPNTYTPRRPGDLTTRLAVLYGAAGVLGSVPLTRVLLDAGAEPNDGETLFHAAGREHYECLEVLLEYGADLNHTGHPAGNTPLHWILDWTYKPPVVEWLLAHGADPNVPSGPYAETALHVVARRHRTWAIDLLLHHDADIDARTKGGSTAYAHARRRGFDEIAALLDQRGADSTLTPADELASHLVRNEFDAARAMIAADPKLVPGLGEEQARILPDLAGRDEPDAVALLLDAGADIAARGLDGGTPLHQAAWFGQPAVAKLLIERGAPIEIRGDEHDSTPLGWVAHGSRFSGDADTRAESYAKLAELLIEAGASIADPVHPEQDPHGRWLLVDASPAVVEVLNRYGAKA